MKDISISQCICGVVSSCTLTEFILICYDSDTGAIYAKKLANFVEKRLKSERAASVSFIIDWQFYFEFLLGRQKNVLSCIPAVRIHLIAVDTSILAIKFLKTG